MNRFAPRLGKFVIVALLFAPTAVGAQSGLLGSVLGNLPIVGPLLNNLLLPLVGSLLSTDLLQLVVSGDDRPVRAIVRGDVAAIQTAAARDGITVLRVLNGLVVVEATPSVLNAFQNVEGVTSISLDNLVSPSMTVSDRAMAADQARAGSGGLLGSLLGTPSVNGKGIGVAIVDSGIASHSALSGKVVASVNYATGETSAADAYGHGTHIAGIIAGSISYGPTPLYKNGIAPGAHLVNVRVLNRQGVGYTSDVIAGIQWVLDNRVKYSIRVMNLSLGHPIQAPCAMDPLCLAAEDAAAKGLVVVASAGNSGKDAAGNPVLGSVSTPGNAPGVITVGALNTWNTVSRGDDTVTTYSSRGPTRYDMMLKPDVVAPGNKIVSLEAQGSYLSKTYPSLHVAGSGYNAYSMMSGTSMAAAMVSGGAALLLQSTPSLTPRHVKVALQATAEFMPEAGLIAGGTGSVNLVAARKMASGDGLLGILSSLIGGSQVVGSGYAYLKPGARLDQSSSGLTRVFGMIDQRRPGWTGRSTYTTPSQIIWGDTNMWTADQQIIWGDQIFNPAGQQIIWGDQIYNPTGQQIIWGDQIYNPSGQQIIWGDHDTTGGQQIIWGDSTPSQGGW
ncbi:MAG TPA: S8 family serine peptidase [Vicinamibacterales bacterium]